MILPCLVAFFVWAAVAQTAGTVQPPEQPIPFSHKRHAGELRMKCAACHANPDPGEMMTFTRPATCMKCHSGIKTESPAIQKLAAFAKEQRSPNWVRVYEIPSYVRFSHRAHLAAGGTCTECHGPVKERERLYRETDISMTGCMNCHQAKGASNECTYCHDPMQ